ncbi:nuclear envelope-associated protein 2 isoform X4 [Zea mays]|uniref:nuclear envelope-associated protein 2 isoform X4 n=1 Tax=Zea mays TaxID=4577 RepID=UPI0002216FA7|nr:nuclear envelope-associated protein 2 isoform X4 [Zea mays]
MLVSESTAIPSSLSCSLELDPLLRDLVEKKLSLKRNVTAMATELRDARNRLASQELLLAQEIEARKFRNELDGFRSQLPVMTTLLHCSYLLGKLNDRNNSMSEGEFPVNNLAEQLNHLEKCLESRDPTLRQFKDCYSLRTESDITDAFARVAFDNDDGVAKPGEDIRALSAHWVNRSKELESQLDQHRRTAQELKRRLRNQMAVQQPTCSGSGEKRNLWESSAFKLIASVSMLVLFTLANR